MKNIKGFAIANDGNMKRIAITYDELDDVGKVTGSNIKINRLVTDSIVLDAVTAIENYVQTLIDTI